MHSTELKQQLFNHLKEKLPPHLSLVDELEDLLDLSADSVYRRIRGDKPITMAELKTICFCAKKATMVVRVSGAGAVERIGKQVEIGGNDRYIPLCRKHFSEAIRTGNCPGWKQGN